MAIEWSGLSPELLVRLDRSASQPLRAQLEASLREAIRGGRLRAGERLPSSRELARELGVSRGMVQDCYGQLLAEGYLTSRTGSATRVAGVAPLPPGADETAVIAAARERRVGLHGIGAYRGNPDTAAPPALVMGFGNVREQAIEPAIAGVADLLS